MAIFSFLEKAVPFGIAVSILVFAWGFIMYMLNPGDAEKRKDGINIMIMGALIVLFAVVGWGIVGWIRGAV